MPPKARPAPRSTAKKPVRPAKKTAVKKAVVKKPAKKAAAKGRTTSPKTAKPAPRRVKAAAPKKPAKAARPAESLGRPLVRAEEKLYMLFKEDYHARQIFEFLRVDTVGELEQFSPQQIIQILSAPVRNTVERIRQRLADNKRALRDDTGYAREHRPVR
ncbi:MAG: hypothetical protein KF774_08730 [Planctomyces sp.]|nr:hypothetical protein [Planctomyces sp.]